MVYRGKPSTACKQCIKRRIKCDRREGGCSQCRRVGEECSGYPQDVDPTPIHLVQTTDTMRQHGGRARALDGPRAKRSNAGQPVSWSDPPSPLSQDLDELALACCYKLHIIHPCPANVQDEKVLACLKALGMASYANLWAFSLQEKAFDYYLTALRIVNIALQSPVGLMQNATLLAVIALSCFESISGGSLKRSLKGWSVHIQGMAALIERRGMAQMQTHTGRLYFMQACGLIAGDCVRSGLPIPGRLHDLLSPLIRIDARFRPLIMLFGAANLKSDAIHGRITEPYDIIARARALDLEFASAYYPVVPVGFEYKVIAHRTRAGSQLPSYVLLYRNAIAATMWNTMRTGRLLCHGMIIDILKREAKFRPDIDFHSDIEASQNIISLMSMDILASVPQDTGTTGVTIRESMVLISGEPLFPGGEPLETETSFHFGDSTPVDLPALHIVRSHAQILNLVLAGRLAGDGSEIRQAVCRVLNLIARVKGVPLASIFGSALEEDRVSQSVINYRKKADAWIFDDDDDSYDIQLNGAGYSAIKC